MTLSATTFVDYQATPKVTAAFLNNLQTYVLQHHLEHASTGADPITISLAGATMFQYIPIPAKDWVAYTPLSESGDACIYETSQRSNGPAQVQLVYGSTLDGASTIGKENAYARVSMPRDWDGGLLTASMVTETTVASTAKTISFKIYGKRIGDGGTADVALSTSIITLNDINTGAELENHSAESSQFGVDGTGGDIRLRLTCNSSDHDSTTKIKFHQLMLKCICTKAVTS